MEKMKAATALTVLALEAGGIAPAERIRDEIIRTMPGETSETRMVGRN